MESPISRRHWGYPRRHPSAWEIHEQRKPQAPSFRVVNIPVRFVGSERSRSDLALKIQKLFRGFLVRKRMKKIMAMRRKVDEIEKRLLEKEVVELIRSNGKEKLKVNEMLMDLLLDLDSVRSLDSGVRDSRKTVIKKVIGLQEKVDAIVAGEKTVNVIDSVPANEIDKSAETIISENIDNDSADAVDSEQQRDEIVAEAADISDFLADRLESADNVELMPFSPHSNETMQEVGAICESPDSHCSTLLRNVETNSELTRSVSGELMISSITEIIGEAKETIESESRSELKSSETSDGLVDVEGLKCQGIGVAGEISDARAKTDFKSSKDVDKVDLIPSASEGAEDNVDKMEAESQPDSSTYPENPGKKGEENVTSDGKFQAVFQSCNKEAEENSKRNKELLERMADEHERMIGLMAELFEKNEMQTRLLKSLSQRVEHLEKAIICEKLRKKKKRNAATTLDCSEKRRETKKLGKKA